MSNLHCIIIKHAYLTISFFSFPIILLSALSYCSGCSMGRSRTPSDEICKTKLIKFGTYTPLQVRWLHTKVPLAPPQVALMTLIYNYIQQIIIRSK